MKHLFPSHPGRRPCQRPFRSSLLFLSGLWLLCAVARPSAANLDYLIVPVQPRLEPDAATLFAGERSASPAELAIPAPAWTVEMLLRVPPGADLSRDHTLLSWEQPDSHAVRILLGRGSARGIVQVRDPADGRWDRLQLTVAASGRNGQTVATDRSLYLAVGADLAGGRAAAVLREPNGDLMDRRAESFQVWRPTEETRPGWEQFVSRVATRPAASVAWGDTPIEIGRVRVSNVFRSDVLVPTVRPVGLEGVLFSAEQLDPQRARARTVSRRVGQVRDSSAMLELEETFVPLSAGDAPLVVPLGALGEGIYSLMVHGTIDPRGREKLERVWRPCPMEFELRDAGGVVRERGRLLVKQGFTPRRLQGFHFHVNTPGEYTARFRLADRAQETVQVTHIILVDQLADTPNEAVKRTRNLGEGPSAQLSSLNNERRERDERVWQGLPPLNLHLQVHEMVREFRQPPASLQLPRWETKAYLNRPAYSHPEASFAPLDFIQPESGEVFPHEKIVAGEPWPGEWSDDGAGVFFPKERFPELPHDIVWAPRAILLGRRVQCYLGLLGAWDYGSASLAKKYFEGGDPNVGHDAALALVRLAYDWPALEMTLHEVRVCTHAPDFEFNVDWTGSGRNGKYFYDGWSGANTINLLEAYDQVFPYIRTNAVFAAAVQRFIPWVRTPEDVIRFLDRWLVFASVRDIRRGLIRAAPVEDMAARVLGPHRLTEPFFDLTRQEVVIYPYTGTYQELYATALNRCGSYHAGSFLVYALGDAANTIRKARLLREARNQGVKLPMDLSDVERYPKVRGACRFMLAMWPAGGFPFMLGDASGGPHTGPQAYQRLRGLGSVVRDAYELAGDPRHAWVLVHWLGETNSAIVRAAATVRDPILHAPSRVVPGYGAILECGVDETNLTRKTAATLRVGTGQAHTHSDYLDLNLFALGLPLAVDLACRTEGKNWSRPKSASAGLHNMAIAHANDNIHEAGAQTGEPWLRAFAPPLVRASYINREGTVRLDRDVILMQVGDSDTHYAFDLQRLRGEKLHTWSFHGCESDDLLLNVPMEAKTVRWIDRTLEGTHKVGRATDTLQAVWTMTREGREIPHNFNGGGVIRTVACEPHVLGPAYDSNAPPVRVRATLLGHAGDTVMQGNPYSEAYRFCFPFLWVQREVNGGESVYPAMYEWYRGDTPVLARAELVSREPLTVRVTTTSGQVDTFTVTPTRFAVVSRDARGIRFAKLNGGDTLEANGISIKADRAACRTRIEAMDYRTRTLQTRDPLPANPAVTVGNEGHRTFLELKGMGTRFTFADDLLCHEGRITRLEIQDGKLAVAESNQQLFQADWGNRKQNGFTVANEALTWLFRGGEPIQRPTGERLTREVFTDANGDGRVHIKTFEVGPGDEVELPTDVTVRRLPTGYEVIANSRAQVRVGKHRGTVEASEQPQALRRGWWP